mgnify:CR=1 FL=1
MTFGIQRIPPFFVVNGLHDVRLTLPRTFLGYAISKRHIHWIATGEARIDIRVSFDGQGVSLIQAGVDRVRIDPLQRSMLLEGRDLTSRLIEARTQESFVNRTASEIADEMRTIRNNLLKNDT